MAKRHGEPIDSVTQVNSYKRILNDVISDIYLRYKWKQKTDAERQYSKLIQFKQYQINF
jgi:hypothetical protein